MSQKEESEEVMSHREEDAHVGLMISREEEEDENAIV